MKPLSKLTACALLATGVVTSAFGQVQVAGTLHVSLDAASLPLGPVSSLSNPGAAGGVFQSVTNSGVGPRVVAVGGGTHGLLFDGNCTMLQQDGAGNPVNAPANLTSLSFTGFSVEAWVFAPTILDDNPVVSWGTRGNCDPNQVSCAYGSSSSYGGLAMWCSDHGWGATGTPPAGAWHHLVWTLDASGNENLYADGTLKATYTGVVPNIDPNNNIGLAFSHGSAGGTANGVYGGVIIGRVRIEDGILTPTQVLSNYAYEAASFTNGVPTFLSAKPLHRWSFTNAAAADATGLVVNDIGTASGTTNQINGTVRNNGGTATFTGTQLTLSGGSSASAPYVDFTNALISVLSTNKGGTDKATFEAWVTPQGGGSWAPVFDIGNTTLGQITGPGGTFTGVNYLGLIATPNGNQNQSAVSLQTGNYFFASRITGAQTHIAMTWDDDAGMITVYENGVEWGRFTLTNRMAGIQDLNNWLGRSVWSPDANLQGSIAEFRIFNRLVSPAELLNDFQVGPSVVGNVLKWNGNVSGNWDINTTPNWLSGVTGVKYNDGGTVQFDDSLTGTPNVNITTAVQPSTLTVNNTSSNYVFSGAGSISGSVGLTKTGNGSLTLNNVNNYTGPTVMQGGTLIVTNLANGGTASAIGASTSAAANLAFAGGSLSYRGPAATINRSYLVSGNSTLEVQSNLTILGAVTATGGNFTKSGAAQLTYAGANINRLSSGDYYIGNGTVLLDGTSGLTNTTGGQIFVGFDQAHNANFVVSNTVVTNGNWFAIARGNGTGGYTSTVSLYNSHYSVNQLSMGYANGIAGNKQTGSLTLNGNSQFINTGGSFNLSESGGSSCSVNVLDNSWLYSSSRILLGMANAATGAVTIANSGAITNGGYVSLGVPGVATATLRNNAAWTALVDFNVTDIAGTAALPSLATLNIQDNAQLLISTLYLGKSANCTGTINQSGGSVKNSGGGEWRIGGNASGAANQLGIWNFSGGTISVSDNFQVGAYGVGYFNQTGGFASVGGWVDSGRFAGGTGYINVLGGVFLAQSTGNILFLGENGTGTLNVDGTGTVICAGNNGGTGLGLGWAGTGSGTLNLTNGNVIVTNNVVIGNSAAAAGGVNLYGGVLSAKRVLMNAGSGTLNFYGGTLRAMPGSGANFLGGLTSATINSGGAIIDTDTNVIAITQDFYDGGNGHLTKIGAGTLTLAGSLYFSGPTVVSAGKLILPAGSGLYVGSSALSVADGADLDIQLAGASGQLGTASMNATLGASTGSSLDFELGSFGNPAAAPLYVGGTLTHNGTTTVNISGTGLTVNQFPLIQYGALAGAGNFVLGSLPPGVVAQLVTNVPNNSIDLQVTAVNILLWTGLNGGAWDVNTTIDWMNLLNLTPASYLQGSSVIFDDSVTGSNVVNVATTVTPSAVTFSNNTVAYTLAGAGKLSGSTGVGLYGTGMVTLATTNNNYTGATFVAGGALNAGAPGALSSNSPLVLIGASLNLLTTNQAAKSVTATNGLIAGTAAALSASAFLLENSSVNVALAGVGSLNSIGLNGVELNTVSTNNSYVGKTVLTGGALSATNLANGGVASSIGASSANPTNLVFAGGGLAYEGPSATINRGYLVAGGGELTADGNLTLSGPVQATSGNFTKDGNARVTYAATGTNYLSAGGGGAAYAVGAGTVVLDGSAGIQTNRIIGDLWVGFNTTNSGAMIVTNTSLGITTWLAIDRGNGTLGLASSLAIYNSLVTCGNVSLGYDNGIFGNSEFPTLDLYGNSALLDGAACYVGESGGSQATVGLYDNSAMTVLGTLHVGRGEGAVGSLTVSNSASLIISNNTSIGLSGQGTLTVVSNAVYQNTGDLNVGDLTGSTGVLNIGDNAHLTLATLYVGKTNNTSGTVNQTGGSVVRVGGGDWRIGGGYTTNNDTTAAGTYNLSGGSVVVGPNNFQVGAGGQGEWNQTGGSITMGAYPSIGRYPNAIGQVDISGGTFADTNLSTILIVGEQGNGTLNITGTGWVSSQGGMSVGHTATGSGIVNLGGGMLSVSRVYMGGPAGASSTFNFNGGVLQALPGSYPAFFGGLNNAFVLAGGAIIDSGANNNLTIAQPLLDGGAGGGLIKLGNGVLRLTGVESYTGMTTVSNGTLLVNGVVPGPATAATGTLGGVCEIDGPITVNPLGTLAPGDLGIGALTNHNTLTLQGATVAEVARSSGVLANDAVVGMSQVTYGGTLTVNNVGSDKLQVGDTFQLFSAGAYTGTFATVSLPAPYIWTNHLALNGTIQVIALGVNTNPTNIVASVSSGSLQLSWPSDHIGWTLQVQTNSLANGLDGNWVNVPASTTTNKVSFPIDALNGSVFFRLQY